MSLTGEEITTIYDRHATRMVAGVARSTFDAQVALDIVGEAFARAFEHRARFKGDWESSGRAWVSGIADNLVRDYFRSGAIERRAMEKLGVERQFVSDEDVRRIESLAGTAALRDHLAAALSGLSEENRQAVELRVVDELGYDAVAESLGISATAARARVSRGLRELRELLEARGIDYVNGAVESV
jgi:RNA polymerase sigma-70 factor (ECF subfamily)